MKKVIVFLLLIPGILFADGGQNRLQGAMDRGESKIENEKIVEEVLAAIEKLKSEGKEDGQGDGEKGKENTLLKQLVSEVNELREEVDVTRHIKSATQKPSKRKKVGAKTVFNYREGAIFEVYTAVDSITDITLAPGEKLSNVPVAGDTVRWKLSAITSGSGQGERTHLIIKPLEVDIETNFVITTDRHVYHIKAISGDWYMPTVSFNYPDEDRARLEAQVKRKEASKIASIDPANLEFRYRVEESDYKWRPVRVFDDGRKTYIQMPEHISSYEAPAFFILSDDTPELTNYRVKGVYYIIDRLFTEGVLRVGPEEEIKITGPDYTPSFFERIF